MRESRQSPLARLAPEVLAYASASFALNDELKRLDAVNRVTAPEAVVFYCGRILEALVGDALSRLGQVPTPNVYSNLQVLEHLNRLGIMVRHWAHALRRLGNVVRHIRRRVEQDEAVLALLFAEACLEWFFCDFSHGHRLAALTVDGAPLGLVAAEAWCGVLRSLEELATGRNNPPGLEEMKCQPGLLITPVLPAVLAEIRLSRGEHEAAHHVLQSALEHCPDDLRLRQLMGLCWSRAGQLDNALQWLEPLLHRFADDDETAGITAGVYKRQWQADRSNRISLEKSHRAYRDAWKRSGKKSVYLGINSATTALWLDRADEARRLARGIEELLQHRMATLPADLRDQPFRFWDQVALAEAQVLQGNYSAAQQTYHDAFTQNPERRGDIEVCRKQFAEIMTALGQPNTGDHSWPFA